MRLRAAPPVGSEQPAAPGSHRPVVTLAAMGMGVAAQPCDRSVRAADIGDVTGVTIAHDGAHSASSWLLESVALTRCNTIRRNAARRRSLRRPHLPCAARAYRSAAALQSRARAMLRAHTGDLMATNRLNLSSDRWVPCCRQSDGFCWTMPCNEATPQSRFPFCPQSAAAVRCTLYCRAMPTVPSALCASKRFAPNLAPNRAPISAFIRASAWHAGGRRWLVSGSRGRRPTKCSAERSLWRRRHRHPRP